MNETPFHMTRMGHTYYTHTVPELVRQLVRLNENLERVIQLHPKENEHAETQEDGRGRTEEEAQPPHG